MMSNSNSFSFFGIPDDYNFPQINLHHKKVSDSRIGHMLHNFPPEEETLDPSNTINISSFVALQNLQNTANLTRSCGDLRGQLIYGDNIHLQEDKVVVGDLGIITTRSVESLDCLLSATYTNTDTSIEDDGISSLFCDGKSLWTFGSPAQANAITSGESAGHCQQTSSNQHDHNQAKFQSCFPQSEVQRIRRTMEPSRSCKMVEEESITSQNLNSSISRIQDNMHDHNSSNTLKTVGSCITVPKESGRTTSPIPENATKKRNISETFLKSGPPSYHFLDTDIYSEKSNHHDFHLFSENPENPKKHKSEKCPIISFQQPNNASTSSGGGDGGGGEQDSEAIAQMKDIIYGAAAFRPVNLGVDVVEKPKRKNVKISDDPQTVAARQRRERISERIRVLQTLVPGGTKMDTASMLDEAANYLKFLRSRVKELEALGQWRAGGFENYYSAATFACPSSSVLLPFLHPLSAQSYFCLQNPYSFNHHRN